jgi:hypothetical protein
MIDWAASMRRFTVVGAALVISAICLHGSISSALLTRGDALLYMHDPRSQVMYRRAFDWDTRNIDAADRFVFGALLSHRRSAIDDGISLATRVLTADPSATSLRMDRALCLQVSRRYADAERDFEIVGRTSKNVQALAFAASDARLKDDLQRELALLELAARIDPGFVPVRLRLERRTRWRH